MRNWQKRSLGIFNGKITFKALGLLNFACMVLVIYFGTLATWVPHFQNFTKLVLVLILYQTDPFLYYKPNTISNPNIQPIPLSLAQHLTPAHQKHPRLILKRVKRSNPLPIPPFTVHLLPKPPSHQYQVVFLPPITLHLTNLLPLPPLPNPITNKCVSTPFSTKTTSLPCFST